MTIQRVAHADLDTLPVGLYRLPDVAPENWPLYRLDPEVGAPKEWALYARIRPVESAGPTPGAESWTRADGCQVVTQWGEAR